MKKFLFLAVMLLSVWTGAFASVNEKLSASTQLLIAERDGKISLDIETDGPMLTSRPPLLRMRPVERVVAAPERVNGVEMVSAFIHIDPRMAPKLENMGVIVQEKFNEFVTAMIPVAKIEQIAQIAEVKEVNVARKLQKKTNMARSYTNTDDVINYSSDAVSAGLPQAFKGKGVVVGVIDGGIDFAHTLYNDASGNTRIKRVYKATSSSNLTEYTSNFTSISTDDSSESHGTHTSTTAAGRSMTVGSITYGGMAPEADIVLVGLGSYMYDTNIANAIKKIFDYADAQNEPAVVSISLGSHIGAHDGTGELASVYSQYAGSKANHIIAYAASNDANGSYGYVHNQGTATTSTPFTAVLQGTYYAQYYGSSSYLNRMYYGYDIFYNRTANQAIACKLHVVNTSTKSVVWTSSAITSSTSSVSGITTYFGRSPSITIAKNSYNNKYYVQLYFNQVSKASSYTSSNYALAVSVYPTSGSSCVIDGWDVSGYNAFSSFSGSVGGYTFVAGSDASCISDEAADENVISVGAYCSKRVVSDYNGTSHTLSSYTLGDIAYFSSYQTAGYGPTGASKPDICAPGATIVSGINHYDTQGYMANAFTDYGYYLVYNSTTSSLGSMDGTSMATPCAAGIIALYLQAAKYAGKTLNTEGIRDVFANTAITDSYTTKANFGRYGKIDALAGVKYILGDTQVNPSLTVDPTELTFTGNTGETYTKTFTVKGTNLTNNVTLSVSGTGYTVSPSSLTVAQATAGATVTVTYNPTAAGTHTGTVTVASTGADSKTVSLSGTATNKPVLTATPSSLSFSTTVGTSVTKTFVVKGTDLTSTVSLSVSGTGFSIDKTTITRTTATNGSTVTVTYNPTAAGTHTGTVTITSTGADAVTVPLNGTATEVVRTINVNPTALSFSAVTGQTATKSFTVTGTNLTGNLTLTLNNANGIYSIDRTSITATQAANGVTVNVTYSPTAAGSSNASVTISGGGAESKTVSLTGTAEAPTITASTDVVNVNAIAGETATATFTVSGSNLTGALTLALNDANGVYSINPTSISAADAANGVAVTVTYAPTTFGNQTASIVISGGGANPVTVNLNGTANLVKYAPVMLEANDAYVALTRFRADWTDQTPTYNVSSYTLEVSPKPSTPVTPDPVMLEEASFTGLSAATNSSGQLTNVASSASQYLPTDWTAQTGLWVNQGFIISGNISGYTCGITTKTYDFTGYDKATIVMSAYSYYSSNYGTATIRVKTSAGSQELVLATDDFTTYTIVLDVAESDQIVFEGAENMFAIENIKVYAGDLTAAQNMLMAAESGDANYRMITEIDPADMFYVVENLTAEGTFLYRVKALYIDGTESDWSNIEEVTLHENAHPYTLGDVNHDNRIDVSDVTMLISYILGEDNGACLICGDVNGDNRIDVSDVTALINIILGNTSTLKLAKPAVNNMLLEF